MSPRPAVAVVGLGLIGGSVALRLAAAGYRVVGYDADRATRELAAGAGLAVADDVRSAVDEVAGGADGVAGMVVLAVPLTALDDVFAQLSGLAAVRERLVLTDVTSVKVPVLELARAHGLAGRYVGGHPMAGTEHSGFAAADPALLDGARWVLCLDGSDRSDRADSASVSGLAHWLTVAAVVTDLGARVVPATAADQDAAVARISHLPHVFAELLAVAATRGTASGLASALAAGSFRDGTRVAATRPGLVAAMWDGNAAALADVLADVAADLDDLRRALRTGGPTRPVAEAGHAARLAWQQQSGDAAHRAWRRDGIRIDADNSTQATDLLADLRDLGRRGGWVERIDADGLYGFEAG